MKLLSLIKDCDVLNKINFKNVNITNLSIRADQITSGGLFFAIKGNNFDGKEFVHDAIKCGAKAVVSESTLDNISIPQIIVKDIRLELTKIARTFFNYADKKIKIIGIIGTNGKTTTATILYHLLRDSGNNVGFIGTNKVLINDLELPNLFTTPDPIELFYTLEQMSLFDVKYVVMEISAHAIFYKKTYGICPDYLVYTNISNEHLDFFGTMENYSNTKLNYIASCPDTIKVINIDDSYSHRLVSLENVITYGLDNPADVFAVNIEDSIDGVKFVCNASDDIMNIKAKLSGEYNVYNIISAIAVAKHIGIDNRIIEKSIEKIHRVDGRWEIFDFPNGNKVIVDYAHTPDGFEKVLSTVKKFAKSKIITLFGCVGYSDKIKRKLMGDIASKYSDFIILSSDNYGDESFDEICDDIGIVNNCCRIKNREDAVRFAINMLNNEDILVLLGKGNENTQKSKKDTTFYNEIEHVKTILKNIKG